MHDPKNQKGGDEASVSVTTQQPSSVVYVLGLLHVRISNNSDT